MQMPTAVVKENGPVAMATTNDEALDAFALMELQGSADLVTKTELLDAIRSRQLSVSDRTVTYYMTEQILPKAIRVGNRSGAYPRITTELLTWVLRARTSGTSVDAIRELIPVWEFLVRARRSGEVALSELEYISRERVDSVEANHWLPWLVRQTFQNLCRDCAGDISWVLKDGTRVSHTDGVAVTFHVAELDEVNPTIARRTQWMQMCLPGFAPSVDAPDAVVLGVPNGVPVLCDDAERCTDSYPNEATDPVDAVPGEREVSV